MFGRKKHEVPAHQVIVPVLCKFWKEDDVWNGCAEHLPVAAFGDTFEQAQSNLCDAIMSHMHAVAEAGQIGELVTLLQRRAEDHMLVAEIVPDSLMGKMLVPVGQEVALDCV